MTPHRIRLQGFWTRIPLEDRRQARYVRRFGRPGNLTHGETVWPVEPDDMVLITGVATGPTAVLLNGDLVAETSAGSFAYDVTERLQTRNELAFEGPSQPEDVALEIRSRLSRR